MFLAALSLSPTLEARLSDVQKRVFELYDLTSALALPPIIPLHLSSRPHDPELARRLCRGERPSLTFSGFADVDDYLVAALAPEREIEALRSCLGGRDEESGPCEDDPSAGSEDCPEDVPGARSLARMARLPGVYLAYGEGRATLAGARDRMAGLPSARIQATSLVDIRLVLYPEIGPWWEAVAWEYVFEYRMRKRTAG